MIYVDMDGVLVDFVAGIRAKYRKYVVWPAGEYNPCIALDLPGDIWDELDVEFWASLKPTLEFGLLMDLLKRVEFRLATTAVNTDCMIGKTIWCDEYMDGIMPIFIQEKELLAHQSVLIDDSDSVIDKFRMNYGVGVLMPRPWNRENYRNMNSFFRQVERVTLHDY